MATTNGTLSPPAAPTPPPDSASPPPTASDLKRKREDGPTSRAPHTENPSWRMAQTQRDMLDILQRHDITPSFLHHPVDAREGKERSPKKARLSHGTDHPTTIAAKLSSGTYPHLVAVRKDAEYVSHAMANVVSAEAKEQGRDRLSVDDLKRIQLVNEFDRVIANVIAQERRYEAAHGSIAIKEEAEDEGDKHPRGADELGQDGTVLTLYGNAPTPRQLFSSSQRRLSEIGEDMVKTELPVEQMSLPNGLSATKIIPLSSDDVKNGPTFDESFAPPFSLPPLNPPKVQKRSTTRETTITWEFKDPMSRSKKGGYTTQSQTVGDWLGYGGVDGKDDPSSPREKRKQRDRALSGGESSGPPPSKDSLTEALAKEEEALFRRAYSSFAPSCDNSRAIVPEQTKSMLWWNKIGERRYKETFTIDPALMDESSALASDGMATITSGRVEDEDFSTIVDELDDFDEEFPDAESARDKTDVDQVLRDVSELLETLASHQRIRNATLASSAAASRTPISPAPTLTSRIGRPDSPAEDEVSTYHSLRRELAYLILRLPPYAVAKLNGDQLADLGISKLIAFESNNVKGTMEEDQVARLAKYTAMATAAGIASLTRPGSSSGQHYSSTNSRTPAIGQAANTRYGQSAQYGASRTPMQPQFQRSTSSQSMYGTPSSTAPRPGFGQPNQYSRPQPPFSQSSTQQYYRSQQTPGNYGGYSQQHGQSTPFSQSRSSYSSSQPLAQFQQRAVNAAAYQSGQQHRTASPIKPVTFQPPTIQPQRPQSHQQPQPQTQQPASGRGTPVNYPSQPATPVNGNSQAQPRLPQAVVPRESSGTPQPIAPHPPAASQAQQETQTNGHALLESIAMPSGPPTSQATFTSAPASEQGTPQPPAQHEATTSRPRTCELCFKAFDRPSSYVVHMRTHTGERPYNCEVVGCGKGFAVRSNLNRHLRATHHMIVADQAMDAGIDEDSVEEMNGDEMV